MEVKALCGGLERDSAGSLDAHCRDDLRRLASGIWLPADWPGRRVHAAKRPWLEPSQGASVR